MTAYIDGTTKMNHLMRECAYEFNTCENKNEEEIS